MQTDHDAFLWRQRLTAERAIRNLTDTHVRILLFTQGAIEDGADELRQADVAAALTVAIRTVGEAYRRARAVGLLDWDAQFRTVHGVRRRTVNHYRLVMPQRTPTPRPELKRKKKPLVLKLSSCSAHSAEPLPLRGFEERFAAKIAEEKRLLASRMSLWLAQRR